MRLSLVILGVIAAIVCVEKPAEAQNGARCIYINGDSDGNPHCRYATFEQCLADRLGSDSCGPSPYPSSPNHLRQLGPEGAKRLRLCANDSGGMPVMSGKDVALSPLNMRLAVADFAL
jgi:hypothetical protein